MSCTFRSVIDVHVNSVLDNCDHIIILLSSLCHTQFHIIFFSLKMNLKKTHTHIFSMQQICCAVVILLIVLFGSLKTFVFHILNVFFFVFLCSFVVICFNDRNLFCAIVINVFNLCYDCT